MNHSEKAESAPSTPGAEFEIRRRILFTGRVQGVGFRYTTLRVARHFRVTGYVKNLADGRVELIAEGEPIELERLQSAVREAMRGHIEHEDIADAPATGEFDRFAIRR